VPRCQDQDQDQSVHIVPSAVRSAAGGAEEAEEAEEEERAEVEEAGEEEAAEAEVESAVLSKCGDRRRGEVD
jgi:hypothetical protein